MRQAWRFVLAGWVSFAAVAQEPLPAATALEIGVRYWISAGETSSSHDASSVACFGSTACGNPTSTLTYDKLDAHAVELFVRRSFGERWFVKGNLGIGAIPNGRLIDQDFLAGQLLFLESVSGLSGKLYYGTADIGRELWTSGNTTFGLFAGYQRWNERLDAYGISNTGNAGFIFVGTLPGDNVPIISNDQTWDSARIGLEWKSTRGRTRFQGEVALVPYARYRNEDSHWLRSDLGPAPNIIAEGRGAGVQLDLEVRRSYPDFFGLDFGVGYRLWKLSSTKGDMTFGGETFPVVDLDSKRHGFTFTVAKVW